MRCHGGKWLMAKKIIKHFPKHRIYLEAFGGAGSVMLQKPRSYCDVYNDLNGDVVNVFKVLRDNPKELERLCRLTPFSRTEYGRCTRKAIDETDSVDAARMIIFRSFAGFGSGSSNPEYLTGFRRQSMQSNTAPCKDWMNWPNNIKTFAKRLQGVCIESEPAATLVRRYDHDGCLIYLDPPYPAGTRNSNTNVYRNEMSDQDHIDLAAEVRALENAMVCISGYACDLYDKDLYPDWRRTEFPAMADGAKKRTEVLWMNYPESANAGLFADIGS